MNCVFLSANIIGLNIFNENSFSPYKYKILKLACNLPFKMIDRRTSVHPCLFDA